MLMIEKKGLNRGLTVFQVPGRVRDSYRWRLAIGAKSGFLFKMQPLCQSAAALSKLVFLSCRKNKAALASAQSRTAAGRPEPARDTPTPRHRSPSAISAYV
jgi:hypothetical protein